MFPHMKSNSPYDTNPLDFIQRRTIRLVNDQVLSAKWKGWEHDNSTSKQSRRRNFYWIIAPAGFVYIARKRKQKDVTSKKSEYRSSLWKGQTKCFILITDNRWKDQKIVVSIHSNRKKIDNLRMYPVWKLMEKPFPKLGFRLEGNLFDNK